MFTVMMFNLPEWIERFSPYSYVPKVPVEEASITSVAVLTIITALLSMAGFVGYRKRDAKFF